MTNQVYIKLIYKEKLFTGSVFFTFIHIFTRNYMHIVKKKSKSIKGYNGKRIYLTPSHLHLPSPEVTTSFSCTFKKNIFFYKTYSTLIKPCLYSSFYLYKSSHTKCTVLHLFFFFPHLAIYLGHCFRSIDTELFFPFYHFAITKKNALLNILVDRSLYRL